MQAIIDRFPGTRVEWSVSKKGVHILALGKPNARGKGRNAAGTEVEMYDRGQYIALTGDVLPGRPAELADYGAELLALKAEHHIGDPAPETAPRSDAELAGGL